MRNSRRLVTALGCAALLLAACNAPVAPLPNPPGVTPGAVMGEGNMSNPSSAAQAPHPNSSRYQHAPEIAAASWINSGPLDWNSLRGKVVVVDFWTFACYNCKNTLPYFKKWDDTYRDRGLVILGVHTPELSFERDVENVRRAVQEYEIKYPVAIDGDFANWNRYGVRAWPTWFIVDKQGNIRYSHIGEGAYDTSERVIQQLLAE